MTDERRAALSRRTFLRGAGVAVALPWLESIPVWGTETATAPRVAKARGITEQQMKDLIGRHTQGRTFGLLGEPRVNVLKLNLALDEATK